MAELTESGCVGFSQAEVPMASTQVLQRALQYAATFGYTVWLRPQELYLGKGVAASGPLATRMGLSGVPVAAETIALHTIFELLKTTGARVHLCRISPAPPAWNWCAAPRPRACKVTADVSINSLHLTDVPTSASSTAAPVCHAAAAPAARPRCAAVCRRWPMAPSTPWCPTTPRG